jgi:hypothetical protein
MMVAVQPEGREVRQRAQLVKAGRKVGKWMVILLIGGGLGWLAGARRDSKGGRREQHEKYVQDGQVPAGSSSHEEQMHGRFDELTAKAKFEKRRLAVPTV